MRSLSDEGEILVKLAYKVLGRTAAEIMKVLIERGEATDEELKDILGIDEAEVRKVLHSLFEAQLVRYRRVRDSKQGWYVYYWRPTEEAVEIILEDRRRRALSVLKRRLEYEKSGNYYICPSCGQKYTFDQAMDLMFRCSECGALLEAYDNTPVIAILEDWIAKLESFNPLKGYLLGED